MALPAITALGEVTVAQLLCEQDKEAGKDLGLARLAVRQNLPKELLTLQVPGPLPRPAGLESLRGGAQGSAMILKTSQGIKCRYLGLGPSVRPFLTVSF